VARDLFVTLGREPVSSIPSSEPLSKRTKYVPKHRHVPERSIADAPKKALKNTVVMSSVAVAVTGVAVSGGVLGSSGGAAAPAAGDLSPTVDAPLRGGSVPDDDREPAVSRSTDRTAADPAKTAALSLDAGPAMAERVELSSADPRDIARALLPQFGFSVDEFGCLDSLWTKESGWRVDADNPSSSAYGIPQALTATHDLGADYMTNPVTQIEWGLGYIRDRYGSPCGAWSHSQSTGWY
jgi:hypothetical protein